MFNGKGGVNWKCLRDTFSKERPNGRQNAWPKKKHMLIFTYVVALVVGNTKRAFFNF